MSKRVLFTVDDSTHRAFRHLAVDRGLSNGKLLAKLLDAHQQLLAFQRARDEAAEPPKTKGDIGGPVFDRVVSAVADRLCRIASSGRDSGPSEPVPSLDDVIRPVDGFASPSEPVSDTLPPSEPTQATEPSESLLDELVELYGAEQPETGGAQ